MASLKEEAEAYEPQQKSKNIADLDSVDINARLETEQGVTSAGESFSYKYIELNGLKYRVPNKVIGDLKVIQSEKPNVKQIKVVKMGTGLETKYTVIPLG